MALNAVRKLELEVGGELEVGHRSEPTLSNEQIQYLVLSHRENGRKVARSLLRKWRVTMPLEEVDSIVDLTLCEAAQRFDPARGASFITFLFYHLRGHLVRAVASATNESNIFMALINGNSGERSTDLGENEAWLFAAEVLSNTTRESECPENLLLEKERATLARSACGQLDELEREVIDRSFVNDEALVDIAETLGYSRCHISRVKKRALGRLKKFIREANAEHGSETELELRRNRRRRAMLRKAA